MPKIPKHELEGYLDPSSPEYAPTTQEIESEEKIKDRIISELGYIESRLQSPNFDPYTGEKTIFDSAHPDEFWDSLMYLRSDYLDQLNDVELRKKLEEKITGTEQLIYKQYIPFIESRINLFGFYNSPLEKHSQSLNFNAQDVSFWINEAREMMKHFALSNDETIDFSSELNRLQEKLD